MRAATRVKTWVPTWVEILAAVWAAVWATTRVETWGATRATTWAATRATTWAAIPETTRVAIPTTVRVAIPAAARVAVQAAVRAAARATVRATVRATIPETTRATTRAAALVAIPAAAQVAAQVAAQAAARAGIPATVRATTRVAAQAAAWATTRVAIPASARGATWAALLAVLPGLTGLSVQAGCLAEPAPCAVAGGTYALALPEGAVPGDTPALIFLHGAGASGMATMAMADLAPTVLARGYALIAPDGSARAGRRGFGWSFRPGAPQLRDEARFLAEVRADAIARFGIDGSRVLLGGFSIGGSMTSYLACAEPAQFTAYAPVAGAFWRPMPEGCAGPVRLFHTHGWTDATVPLEGRPLRDGQIYQGDVFASLEIWRRANGCTLLRPDAFPSEGIFLRRRWDQCAPGSALEFALHPGGHSVPKGWAAMVLDWFEGLEPRG